MFNLKLNSWIDVILCWNLADAAVYPEFHLSKTKLVQKCGNGQEQELDCGVDYNYNY